MSNFLLPLMVVAVASAPALAGPPQTAKSPVTDEYHGVTVVDDYRWLEDWSDAKVKAWSEAQNAWARENLDKLPGVEKIRARAEALMSARVTTYSHPMAGGLQIFAQRRRPPAQQPVLVVRGLPNAELMGSKSSDERVVVDPAELDPSGGTSIDWYVPSPDGKMVAVALSQGGSEMADLKIFDVATGKTVHETIPRVSGGTAGGSLAWERDGKGFYYTRYPRPGERPEEDLNFYVQVYHHAIGEDPAKDRYEIGKDFPKIGEIVIHTSDPTDNVLVSVQKGDGGEFMHFVRLVSLKDKKANWRQFTRYEDGIVQATLTAVGEVMGVSHLNAPRGKVMKYSFSPDAPKLDRVSEFVPQHATDSIFTDFFNTQCFAWEANRLYMLYQTGGPMRMAVYDLMGKPEQTPSLPEVSAVAELCPLPMGGAIFSVSSYTAPTTWMYYRAAGMSTQADEIPSWKPEYGTLFDLSGYQVRRVFVASKDGTKVPLNILCRTDVKQDGTNPVVLTGYGGYGVSITPELGMRDVLLLEQGFILAEANLRGGGEYGDTWHRTGNLAKKQNVFDDFLACAEWLIDNKYTSTQKLAIQGGSNGGLLMGAAFTQKPELFRCVVSHVGIYDMLRVELSPNGAFNIPEFGTVKDKSLFQALYAYSPYHHVKENTKYPSILFLTGANDPRVDPMQSRKMTARMQAAGADVLLRTSANSGHGIGTALSERIEQAVDVTAFLCDRLGVKSGK